MQKDKQKLLSLIIFHNTAKLAQTRLTRCSAAAPPAPAWPGNVVILLYIIAFTSVYWLIGLINYRP